MAGLQIAPGGSCFNALEASKYVSRTYVYIYRHIYTHIYTCIYIYIHIYICIQMYIVYIYRYTHTCICMYLYMFELHTWSRGVCPPGIIFLRIRMPQTSVSTLAPHVMTAVKPCHEPSSMERTRSFTRRVHTHLTISNQVPKSVAWSFSPKSST